jgi:lysophospholipase L1-like esterase
MFTSPRLVGVGRAGRAALSLLLAVACHPRTSPHHVPATASVVRVVFVGDSLVHRSAEDHDLLDAVARELARRHPALQFEMVDAGVNGNTIADIQARLDEDVIALMPAAVVLYWDSDVSEVDESRLSAAAVSARRTNYRRTLSDVMKRLVDAGVHVIVSGPTLIGEAPRGQNPKDRMLDDYRRINRAVARSFNAAYVDTRRAFLAQLTRQPPANGGAKLLTEDGEHLNDAGAAEVQKQFVAALDSWLRTRAAPAPRAPGGGTRPILRPAP